MKLQNNKKYTQISLYVFLTAAAIIVFGIFAVNYNDLVGLLKKILSILNPFIIGFSLAYILNPLQKFFYNKCLKKLNDDTCKKKNFKKGLSIFLTYVIVILILSLLIAFIIPNIIVSVTDFGEKIPSYIETSRNTLNDFMGKYEWTKKLINEINVPWDDIWNNFRTVLSGIFPNIINYSIQFGSTIMNVIIGIVLSAYLLIDKDKFIVQTKKMVYVIFKETTADTVLNISKKTNETFIQFLIGRLLDGAIVGALCYVLLLIFHVKYAILISIIVGLFNIIPFFGPLIADFSTGILLFLVSPRDAIVALIIIIILQNVDGNFIGPKIIGDSIGLSPFWVMFALLVGGGFFGFAGFLLSVPAFALLYSFICGIVNKKIEEKDIEPEKLEVNVEQD